MARLRRFLLWLRCPEHAALCGDRNGWSCCCKDYHWHPFRYFNVMRKVVD